MENELENLKVQTRRKEKVKKELVNKKWVTKIILFSFTLSVTLSFVSEITVPNLNLFLGIIVALIFIAIGILFDIIGVSITAASPKVFHSMNARRVSGANIAVKLIKNSEKVSSFCCDVIGDICGVLSGAISAILTLKITASLGIQTDIQFIMSALVASCTVGGKALGKGFAKNKANSIINVVSKVLSIFVK